MTKDESRYLFKVVRPLFYKIYANIPVEDEVAITMAWYEVLKDYDFIAIRKALKRYAQETQYGYLHLGEFLRYVEQAERIEDAKKQIPPAVDPKPTEEEQARADQAKAECMERLQRFKRGA